MGRGNSDEGNVSVKSAAFTAGEDAQIARLMEQHGATWIAHAKEALPGRTEAQLRQRSLAVALRRVGSQRGGRGGGMKGRGPWTEEEDRLLMEFVAKHGPGNWKNVQELTCLNRDAQSCRLRWSSYLDPNVDKSPFTDGEDRRLIQFVSWEGCTNWVGIAAAYFPTRTGYQIQGRWHVLMNKLRKQHAEQQLVAAAGGEDPSTAITLPPRSAMLGFKQSTSSFSPSTPTPNLMSPRWLNNLPAPSSPAATPLSSPLLAAESVGGSSAAMAGGQAEQQPREEAMGSEQIASTQAAMAAEGGAAKFSNLPARGLLRRAMSVQIDMKGESSFSGSTTPLSGLSSPGEGLPWERVGGGERVYQGLHSTGRRGAERQKRMREGGEWLGGDTVGTPEKRQLPSPQLWRISGGEEEGGEERERERGTEAATELEEQVQWRVGAMEVDRDSRGKELLPLLPGGEEREREREREAHSEPQWKVNNWERPEASGSLDLSLAPPEAHVGIALTETFGGEGEEDISSVEQEERDDLSTEINRTLNLSLTIGLHEPDPWRGDHIKGPSIQIPPNRIQRLTTVPSWLSPQGRVEVASPTAVGSPGAKLRSSAAWLASRAVSPVTFPILTEFTSEPERMSTLKDTSAAATTPLSPSSTRELWKGEAACGGELSLALPPRQVARLGRQPWSLGGASSGGASECASEGLCSSRSDVSYSPSGASLSPTSATGHPLAASGSKEGFCGLGKCYGSGCSHLSCFRAATPLVSGHVPAVFPSTQHQQQQHPQQDQQYQYQHQQQQQQQQHHYQRQQYQHQQQQQISDAWPVESFKPAVPWRFEKETFFSDSSSAASPVTTPSAMASQLSLPSELSFDRLQNPAIASHGWTSSPELTPPAFPPTASAASPLSSSLCARLSPEEEAMMCSAKEASAAVDALIAAARTRI